MIDGDGPERDRAPAERGRQHHGAPRPVLDHDHRLAGSAGVVDHLLEVVGLQA